MLCPTHVFLQCPEVKTEHHLCICIVYTTVYMKKKRLSCSHRLDVTVFMLCCRQWIGILIEQTCMLCCRQRDWDFLTERVCCAVGKVISILIERVVLWAKGILTEHVVL